MQITGYRVLSPAEVALINKVKAHAEATKALVAEVQSHLTKQHGNALVKHTPYTDDLGVEREPDTREQIEEKEIEIHRINEAQPFRWHALAVTKLQEGYMALVRAVAQPSSF